jgi:hypothetical protein
MMCLSPPQEPEDECDDDTQEYARCEGEIEGEVLSLD